MQAGRRVLNGVIVDAKKLKGLREAAELTQGQLAVKAKVGQSHISRLEAGKRPNAHISTVGKLAVALGVRIDDLLLHPHPLPEPELPDFHIYVSRKFIGNPKLQRALVATYEAIQAAWEEEERRIQESRRRTRPGREQKGE